MRIHDFDAFLEKIILLAGKWAWSLVATVASKGLVPQVPTAISKTFFQKIRVWIFVVARWQKVPPEFLNFGTPTPVYREHFDRPLEFHE